ncbi:hypothetical protein HOD05_05110 [Candidatus Woesearchaeota archaeon]|jgi:hypothetical protein|nr:hypothetical protein [Candidatus Woesearchaeota archaeon]MBT4150379.1 hypothetical protein [Candidatus Woesearchaeota archaeon]MBT4247379.1 hypothetical protein [Candidatus Woesearchaeota archaeon]MBT4434566.1 hypothetical protein [Candidatus Woesearchaeota archaeon]MBT7332007.1 hypothetical protein [Candidatus Woesearchaeota archaeon]
MASKKGVDIAELIKAKEAQRKKVLEPEVEAEEETKETKVTSEAAVEKKKMLDKQMSININPRGILKVCAIVVVLMLVFFAGRFSVGDIGIVDSGSDSGSWLTGLFSGVDAVDEVTGEAVPKADEPVVVEEPKVEPKEEPKVEEVVDVPEKTVTTYDNTQLVLNNVKVDWKETWGKIIQLDYTIINGEDGTIKPSYISIRVEGYGDFEKKMPLPTSGKTVKKGQRFEAITNVPKGFAYSESTTGDLTSVTVTATLYDANDNIMGSFISDFSLK